MVHILYTYLSQKYTILRILFSLTYVDSLNLRYYLEGTVYRYTCVPCSIVLHVYILIRVYPRIVRVDCNFDFCSKIKMYLVKPKKIHEKIPVGFSKPKTIHKRLTYIIHTGFIL